MNYGFVDGIMAGDGAEQDIYLLGVDEPVSSYEGVVIAVIHRNNDIEDKWIVAPPGITETIHHYMNYDEIGVQKFYDLSSYDMTNTGELIMKSHLIAWGRKSYDNPSDNQISLEDYNLFRSDYLAGLVPKDFILTIKNTHKYLD